MSSLTNLLRSFLLIFVLNLFKEVSFLSFMLNFNHRNGPKNLRECFPYLSFYPLNMKVRIPQVVVRGRWREEFQYIVGQ